MLVVVGGQLPCGGTVDPHNTTEIFTVGKSTEWEVLRDSTDLPFGHAFATSVDNDIFMHGNEGRTGNTVFGSDYYFMFQWNKTNKTWDKVDQLGFQRGGHGNIASAVPLDSGILHWCIDWTQVTFYDEVHYDYD